MKQDQLNRLVGRLRGTIHTLMRQIADSAFQARLSKAADCINPTTSVPERLPMRITPIVTSQNKYDVLENILGHAILSYGRMARGETPIGEIETLVFLEQIASVGFVNYGAYAKEPSSTIYVLRTQIEQTALKQKWQEAKDKALAMKEAANEAVLPAEETPAE